MAIILGEFEEKKCIAPQCRFKFIPTAVSWLLLMGERPLFAEYFEPTDARFWPACRPTDDDREPTHPIESPVDIILVRHGTPKRLE
jgi:hypothetical protein